MRKQGEKTSRPGVHRLSESQFRVRAKVRDPRTGQVREIDRVVGCSSIKEAVRRREEMIREVRQGAVSSRPTVGGFAKLWAAAKAAVVEPGTADRYATALELHILPKFGEWYCDTLRAIDVQEWVNAGIKKGYAAETVCGWFRVLRVLMRDAVAQIPLERDPTLRVILPSSPEKEGNEARPDELARFLAVVERRYPQYYALAATLAFTGLRFCHVTGLKWEDIDEEAGVIHIRRKHYQGHIGAPTRKKRAPKQTALAPELAEILKAHRARLLRKQHKGLASGWVFSTRTGKPQRQGNLWRVWNTCTEEAKLGRHFQIHGMRRTFNDLARLAKVDPLVTKALTGHVTEKMRELYSTVGVEEKQRAVAEVVQLVRKEKG